LENLRKESTLFGEIDGRRGCTQNWNSRSVKAFGQSQCRLPPQLHNHTDQLAARTFRVNDFEHILEREGLKVQSITRVIVGGYRFRIAIDHDRFKPCP